MPDRHAPRAVPQHRALRRLDHVPRLLPPPPPSTPPRPPPYKPDAPIAPTPYNLDETADGNPPCRYRDFDRRLKKEIKRDVDRRIKASVDASKAGELKTQVPPAAALPRHRTPCTRPAPPLCADGGACRTWR